MADIYNHEVLHATSTFDTEPVSPAERLAWLDAHERACLPVLVAEEPTCARVLGFASLSRWSERCAYARAAEVSVYVRVEARGRGVGRALLQALIDHARASTALGVLLSRISAESTASIGLHRALGFQHIGTMRRVGQKFQRILDVELFDLHLDTVDSRGSEPPELTTLIARSQR